jgi:hypothetical protein
MMVDAISRRIVSVVPPTDWPWDIAMHCVKHGADMWGVVCLRQM